MKNKHLRSVIILAILNIVVFGGYGLLHYLNIQKASIDTNLYISEKRTGEIVSIQTDDFEINFDGEKWHLSEDINFPISTDSVAKFIEKTNNLAGVRKIDTEGNHQRYGLSSPLQTLVLTDSEGVSIKYLLGNFNQNINRYYACEEGSDDIYIITKSVGDTMKKSLYDFAAAYDIDGLTKVSLTSFVCKDSENTVEIKQVGKDTNHPMGSASAWVFEYPYTNETFASANKVDTVVLNVTKVANSQCVDFDADKDTLTSYGLNNTAKSITVNYTHKDTPKTATLYIGKVNEDGSSYVKFEGSNIITLADSSTTSALLGYFDKSKFFTSSVCTAKKAKVDTMRVTYGDMVYEFKFNDNGYTLNGTPCDTESFEAFFNKLSGIVSSQYTEEPNNPADAENTLHIVYTFKDSSYAPQWVNYMPYDENYYIASSGEITGRLVNKRSVESVIELLKAVK